MKNNQSNLFRDVEGYFKTNNRAAVWSKRNKTANRL